MATFYLPASGGYSTDNQYVKYRIKIVEGTYNSSTRVRPVTISAQFWRTNSGHPTHMNGTCYCEINGTPYSQAVSYTNSAHEIDYNSYTELFSKTINVSYDTDGNASITVRAKISLISSVTTDVLSEYQGGTQILTTVASSTYKQIIKARYQDANGLWGGYTEVINADYAPNSTCSWSHQEDEEYKGASVSYTVTAANTKYVDVQRKTYTITYNENGGLCAPSTQTFYYGCNLKLTTRRPTRSGYTFLGWATSSSGTASYAKGANYDSTLGSNSTLYAIWQKNPVQNIYLCDGGTSYAFEYIEGSTLGFGKNGEVYSTTFKEGTVSNGDFAIGSQFIAVKLCEGGASDTLVDGSGNTLTDGSGNTLTGDFIKFV